MLLSFSKEKLNRDVDEYHLKGKVKSVQEMATSFDTTGGSPRAYVFGKVVHRFNEQGNSVEILYYNQGDTLVRRVMEVYKNHDKKRVSYVVNLQKWPRVKTEAFSYAYDSAGKLVTYKSTGYKGHGKRLRVGEKQKQCTYVYDKNGKLAKLIYYTPGGLRSTVSEYDGLGNRCSVTQYSRHNGWPHKTRISYNYVYDSLGRLTEERNINEDGSLLNKYVHKYDKKGNETETDIFNTDSTLSRKISAQFDSLGNPVDVNDAYYFIGGGDVGQKRNATYDDNGFKTEEETYRIKADGTVVLIKATIYENDKMGNWIKSTSFDNNKKGSVETRVIDYY